MLHIHYGDRDYYISERSDYSYPTIELSFRETQNPFTIILSTVPIESIESNDLGSFINTRYISNESRATAGNCTMSVIQLVCI